MARKIEITVSADRTDGLLGELKAIDDLIGLQVMRGASVCPVGDVVSLTVPNSSLQQVHRCLDRFGLGREANFSVSTSEPDSVISRSYSPRIDRDSALASWEEME